MSELVESSAGIKDIVAKLYVLRDSCKGIAYNGSGESNVRASCKCATYSENPDPNTIWYHGAESILQDAIEQLQAALQLINEQVVPAAEYEEDEAETAYSEESEETEPQDQFKEIKRIAIAK